MSGAQFTRRCRIAIAFVAMTCALAAGVPAAVTFSVFYLDGAGEGFNDATLGAQRKAAFEYALDIWAGLLQGTVTIQVNAQFNPLGGDAFSAQLGYAGAIYTVQNHSGRPVANVFYPAALANQHAGTDLSPANRDISAVFNSDVDNNVVLGPVNFYYGTDGNPGIHIDFVTVALHEICHGLGFFDLINSSNGAWINGNPDSYGRLLQRIGSSPSAFTAMSNAQRLAAITSENVFTTGANTVAAHGGNAPIFAPTTYLSGSSISHFDDDSFTPDQLMEHILSDVIHHPGLALYVLQDVSWTLAPTPTPTPQPQTAVGAMDRLYE